mmetsp:Transcript_19850/g.14289  ORF Transcript_19850/g.14289 Transcript_19850/m.14289 type:complete len:132 (+) Transcript_19850:599-994(+)
MYQDGHTSINSTDSLEFRSSPVPPTRTFATHSRKTTDNSRQFTTEHYTLINGKEVKVSECRTCKIIRPPRSFHCNECNACIEVHDHHCPWVGTCIGKRNHQYFLGFLISLLIHCLVGAIIDTIYVVRLNIF